MNTTPYNLKGFVDEILEVLRGLPGENFVPDNPTLNPGSWPYGTVWHNRGTTKAHPAGLIQTDLNDVTIAWMVPLDDLGKAIDYMLPFRERLPMELIKFFVRDQGSQHVQHPWIEIECELGPIDYPGGEQMYGFLILLRDAKIQNEIT